MKLKTIALSTLALLALATTAFAHGDKKVPAPNGGRVLTKIEPHAEFLVLPDRKVQITFIDDEGKALAPASQVVVVTAGDRAAPIKLKFSKSNNVLVSDVALPDGNDFPTVVQIKSAPDAKAVVEKFNLNLAFCDGCKKSEYACTCDHH